jgi:hypothetical protein
MSESGSVRTSLRKRPRVRYDTLGSFEGVDLGDDDELRRLRQMSDSDDDAGHEEATGSVSKKGKGKARTRSLTGRSREASESEFELDQEEEGGHDDDFEHDVVDDESGGEHGYEYDDDDVLDFSKDEGGRSGKKKRSQAPPRAAENSDEDAVLAAQFSKRHKLVPTQKSGTPNVTQFGGAIAKAFKQGNWQVLVKNTLPLHPTGQTFLLSAPDLAKLSDILIPDTPGNPRGQGLSESQRATVLHGHWTKVPLETPWNWWMGQAWWPDCYQSFEMVDGQRKRRKIDWKIEEPKDHRKQKVDVSLGLEDVGRLEMDGIKHMTIL